MNNKVWRFLKSSATGRRLNARRRTLSRKAKWIKKYFIRSMDAALGRMDLD